MDQHTPDCYFRKKMIIIIINERIFVLCPEKNLEAKINSQENCGVREFAAYLEIFKTISRFLIDQLSY